MILYERYYCAIVNLRGETFRTSWARVTCTVLNKTTAKVIKIQLWYNGVISRRRRVPVLFRLGLYWLHNSIILCFDTLKVQYYLRRSLVCSITKFVSYRISLNILIIQLICFLFGSQTFSGIVVRCIKYVLLYLSSLFFNR